MSKSLQTTRRFDALKLWMSLEALGQEQYAAIIDHGVTLAQQVAAYVKEQPALELVMQPQLASVLFRFRGQVQMDDAGIALLNQKIGDALLESGRANVGVTEHNGVTCCDIAPFASLITGILRLFFSTQRASFASSPERMAILMTLPPSSASLSTAGVV